VGPSGLLPPHAARERELFSTLLEASSEPLWLHSPEGHIVAVNKAACATYGHPRQSLLQLRLADLMAPEDRERLPTWMHEVLARGQGRLTCTQIRQNRGGFLAELSARSIRTDQGPLILGTVRPLDQG
jgi:PAS domain S-box-containing protein